MINPYLRLLEDTTEEGTAPAGVRNPYKEMLDSLSRDEDRQRAVALNSAMATNPDQEAELRKLRDQGAQLSEASSSSAPRVPPSANLIQDPARFKADVAMQELAANVADTPALKRKYTQADFAKIAHDDSLYLSSIERTLRGVGKEGVDMARSFLAAAPQSVGSPISGLGEFYNAASVALYENIIKPIPVVGRTVEEAVKAEQEFWARHPETAKKLMPFAGPGNYAQTVGGAFKDLAEVIRPEDIGIEDQIAEGVGQVLSVIAVTLATGGTATATVGFMGMGADQQAEALREAGIDPSGRLGELSAGAAITGGSEMLRLSSMMKALPPAMRDRVMKSVIGRILGQSFEEGVQEALEGAAHNLVTMTYDDDATVLEGVGEQAVVGASVGAIVQGLAELALPGKQRIAIEEEAKAKREALSAEGQLNTLERAIENATEGNLVKRDRAALEEFVNEAAEGTDLTNVFIAPDSLAQVAQDLGIELKDLAGQLGVSDQLQDNALTSTPIVVPVGKFIATVADTDLAGPLMEVAKTNPFLPSRAEIKAAEEAGNEQFVARAEALAAAVEKDETVRAEAQAISERIVGDLNTVGRFTQDANRVYATAATQMYVQLAQRLGITPQQAFDQYPVSVAGQRIGGQYEGQVLESAAPETPEQAVSFETPGSLQWDAAVAKGLDMSTEARMARAQELGYEGGFFKGMWPYDWTKEEGDYKGPEIDRIKRTTPFPAFGGEDGDVEGIAGFITKDPDVAGRFAREEGYILPLMYRPGRVFEIDAKGGFAGAVQFGEAGRPFRDAVRSKQYDTIIIRNTRDEGDVYVALDPSNIRSTNAAFDPDQTSSDQLLAQSRKLRTGDETLKKYGLEPGKKYTTREVAAALEARTRKKHGVIEKGDNSPEAKKKLRDWIIDEVMFEVEQAKANPEKSAVGWYSGKFQAALDRMGAAFTELVNGVEGSNLPGVQQLQSKEGARQFLTALIAVTSDGAKVKDNLRFALAVYAYFRENGILPTNVGFGGERNSSMNLNLANIQALLDRYGAEGMGTYLLQKDTVKNLKKMAAANDQEFSSGYKVDMKLPLAAVYFGPKLGAFYANLRGDTGYLTMDRWWSRTFNRYRGTLLAKPTQVGLDNLKKLLAEDRGLTGDLTDDEALAMAADYVKSYKDKKYKNGTKIETAANTLWKAAFEKLEDQPFNASDREFMIDTTIAAQKSLKRRGVDLTVADIQAVLWYYEKRLYGTLGARQTADISYGDVAVEYAEGFGSGQIDYQDVLGERSDDAVSGEPGGEIYLNQADDGNISADQIVDASEDQTIGPEETFGQEAVERTPQPRVIYEVAPDPNNTELAARWRQLTPEQRLAVSKIVAAEILPGVLKDLGASGRVLDQIGSYLDDTNPSFALALSSGDVDTVAKIFGFVLSQDSMMAISPKEFPGSFQTSALRLDIGDKTFDEVAAIYATLRAITLPDGRQPIGGQTTSDGEMTILLGAEDDARAISQLVDAALENAYNVEIAKVFAAFPEKQEYDYASERDDPAGSAGLARQRARAARSKASRILNRETDRILGSAEARTAARDSGRDRQIDRGGFQSPRRLPDGTTEAVHYGRVAGLTETDPSQWGEGGAFLTREERNRIGEAPARTYFGLNVGLPGGYVKESGTGDNVYYAYIPLDRMYDLIGDPDNLIEAARQIHKDRQVSPASARELAVKEAGYLGFWRNHPSYGMAGVVFEPVPVTTTRRQDAAEQTFGQVKAPMFYSALARAIETGKTTKAPPAQWKGVINNAPGVKAEEIEFSGVLDWLDLQQGSVTRERLVQYINANGVSIEETLHGGSAFKSNERLDEIQRVLLPLVEEQRVLADQLITLERQSGDYDYDGSVSPGVTATLEALLEETFTTSEEIDAGINARNRRLDDLAIQIEDLIAEQSVLLNSLRMDTTWSEYTLPGGENYTELLLRLPVEDPISISGFISVADDAQADSILTDLSAEGFENLDYGRVETETGIEIQIDNFDPESFEAVDRIAANNDAILTRQATTGKTPTFRSGHFREPNIVAHARFKDRTGPNGERVLALEEIQSDWHQRGREMGYLDPVRIKAAKERLARAREAALEGVLRVGMTPEDAAAMLPVFEKQGRVSESSLGIPEVRELMDAARELRDANVGVLDAPFKNNAWVDLVLKRMIRYAAEKGYDSIAWVPGNIQNGSIVEARDNRSDFYDKIVPNAANKLGKKYGAKATPIQDMARTKQGESVAFWSLPITPQLKAVAIDEGFALFARERRGEYSPRLKEIRLNASADFSTFLHELGHHFLEVYDATALTLRDKEASGETLTEGERAVLDDTRRLLLELARQTNTEVEGDVLDWWRGRAFEDRVEMHEQFARLTEAYFMDGKAPTPELQTMFQTFKRWMLQVYKSLTELNVDLNDEVRGILDRMVAAESDIKTAEQNRGLNPMFATKPEFMTDEEWYGYQQLASAATQSAEEQLTARSLRDMKWLSNAKAREIRRLQKEAAEQRSVVEAAVTEEVMSRPINRVRTFLRRGLNPDGSEVIGPHKFSIPLLKAAYPAGSGVDWKGLGYGRYGMLSNEGLDADMVADMFGFMSGEALIRQLLEAEPVEATIEGETDRRMLEQFGDLTDNEALNKAADEALHNVFRGRVLAAEYAALAAASGQRKLLREAAQQIAKQVVGRQNAAKLNPRTYIAAERSASRKAEEALRRNDLTGAATAKRDQLLNFELAREAQRVLKMRDRTLDLFRKVTSAKRDTVSKTRDYDLVQVARAILAAHGMGQVRNAPIEYMSLLKAYDPNLYSSMETTLITAVAKQQTLDKMSVDEFIGLGDLIRQLWTLSRQEKQIEIDGRRLELDQITTELADRLSSLGDTQRQQITEPPTEAQKTLRSFVGLLSSLRRVESWARSMDGGEPGPFTKYIWRPISEAADRYRADRNQYLERFRNLFRSIEPTMGGKKIAAPEINYTFKNKAELLHAILHTGNSSNKRKLLLGRRWGSERGDGTLDDSSWVKFIARMARDGTLVKADFDFVQGVWDLLEETKPLAQETHRKVFGRYFAEITAEPVETPFGTYRGGYVPAIYDQFFVSDAAVRAQQEQVEANDSTMFPSPASGFTKGRTEYNEVLELNLQLLPMHIDKVLKFAHLASPVRDVLRILRDKETARGLEQVDPTAQTDLLLPWLNRAARQIVEEPGKGQAGKVAGGFFRAVRNRSGMGLMFANLVNVAQQFTGFALVFTRVKPQYVGAALVRYTSNPARLTKAVRASSLMMSERGNNQMAAMFNAIDQIIDQKNLYGRTKDWLGRHTYFMQQAVQNVMDVVVWTSAYDQAIAKGATEKEAARQGDAVVRETQGSVFSEDVARIETGPAWARTFTHMYSYFSMWGNLLGAEVEVAVRETGLRKGAGRLVFLYFIGFLAPALLAQLVADALRGQLPEDDEDDGYLDEYLSWFFMTQAKTALAFVPIAGQAGNAAIGAFTDVPYDDRVAGSPAISAIEGAVRTPKSLYAALFEDGDKSRAVKDTLNLMTLLTGLPFQTAGRPISYAVDVAEGDIEPVDELDYLRGLVTGAASSESR